MSGDRPLLVVVGPTASGKTDLALQLAEEASGEIVSADSVQIYRHFDVGTSKPKPAERARIVHHGIDCVGPLEPFDAARWAELAERSVQEIRARGRVPILCGGSFLWVRAFLYGLAKAPPANEVLRAEHRARAEARGREALHAELARVDAESAARLNPNDFVRVSRALEVFELTGLPLSRWHAEHGFRTPRYRARLVGIKHAPEALDRRIAERTRAMLDAGWADEVRALLDAGFGEARAMASVGYRQLSAALRAGRSPVEPALLEEIRRATRIFARRQRTWLRDQPVLWLAPADVASARFTALLERAPKLEEPA